MLNLAAIFASVLIVCLTHWIFRWGNLRHNGVLLPGSFGLPLIGESLQLMIPGDSLELLPFLKTRIQRYGKLFRMSVGGHRIIVVADSALSHFILQQDGKLFESWYMDTFAKVFAQEAAANTNMANVHRYARSMALRNFGMEALREKLLPQMGEFFQATLKQWSRKESVDMKYASGTMALQFSTKLMFGYDRKQLLEKLGDVYFDLVRSLMSIPINIPGTAHYKCMQNYKKALSMIGNIVKKRIASPERSREPEDLLDHVIRDMNTEKFLTEEFVVQLFFGFLFITFDSISTMLTLAMKLLEEHPRVLQELTDEHEAIVKSRGSSKNSISWDEYKSMPFTIQVINEVLRLGNISPGLFRRAKEDVELNGYTIPKGWAIMIATSALHLDSETYNDPVAFNPGRWKDCNSKAMMKNFMPFGAGMKQCAGAEYARVFFATFLHLLVTSYRWKTVSGGTVRRAPMLTFGKGIHIKLTEKQA